MNKIDTLSSLDGRRLLQEIFIELRYQKHYSYFYTLLLCWRFCVYERNLYRYINKEITIIQNLGFFSGTTLWLEEIVNRYYFSTINSFVYFGAAVLLVLIGLRRFSNTISDTVVIAGVAFEALMLLCMFIVMLFTPNEDLRISNEKNKNEDDDLIGEIGELGRDVAAVVIRLETLSAQYNELLNAQKELINSVNKIAISIADAASPNPQMLETMKGTNNALTEFNNNITSLNKALDSLRREEIESAVKKEIEIFLVDRVLKNE